MGKQIIRIEYETMPSRMNEDNVLVKVYVNDKRVINEMLGAKSSMGDVSMERISVELKHLTVTLSRRTPIPLIRCTGPWKWLVAHQDMKLGFRHRFGFRRIGRVLRSFLTKLPLLSNLLPQSENTSSQYGDSDCSSTFHFHSEMFYNTASSGTRKVLKKLPSLDPLPQFDGLCRGRQRHDCERQ